MTLFSRFLSLLLTSILMFAPLSAQTPISPPPTPSDPAVSQALQLRVLEGESTEGAAGSRALEGFLVEVTGPNGAAVPEAAVTFRLPDADPTGRFADGTHAAVAYTDQTGRAKITGIRWNATPGMVALRVTATKGTAHAGILIQQTLTPVSTVGTLAPTVSQIPASALPPAAAPLAPAPHVDIRSLAERPVTPGQPATATPAAVARTPVQKSEPSVTVTSASPGETKHSSKTKWIILAAVAAGAAGAGIAMMGKKASPASPGGSGISVGPPSISVGGGH